MHSFDEVLFEQKPDTVVTSSECNDVISKTTVSPKPTSQHFDLAFSEYSIFSEYLLFQKQNVQGIFVIPSSRTSFVWNGVITIKHGLYSGGVFRFKLLIPDEFPDTSDTIAVIFTPSIYHPLIHPVTGQLDCKQMFQPWKKNVHHVWHIIAYIKSIFSSIDCSNCFNEEAAENYTNSMEKFKLEVKKSIEQSNLILLNDTDPDDSYAFRFTGSDDDGLKAIEKHMLTMEMFSDSTLRYKSDLRTLGLSWLSEKI